MKTIILVSGLLIVLFSITRADADERPRVKAIPTVSSDQTKLLHKEVIQVTTPNHPNHSTPLIDVKGYKTVRVVIERGSCGPCGDQVRANVFSATSNLDEPPNGAQLDSFLIDTDAGENPFATFASRAYDVPGEGLRLTFRNPDRWIQQSSHSLGVRPKELSRTFEIDAGRAGHEEPCYPAPPASLKVEPFAERSNSSGPNVAPTRRPLPRTVA